MPYTNSYYVEMKDGTVKQINPFTETEVWTVPGRATKPISNGYANGKELIEHKKELNKEDYCDFCCINYKKTPPEKARVIFENGNYHVKNQVSYQELNNECALFRRVANLWEIVSYYYWAKNYNFRMKEKIKQWKDRYLSDQKSREHILNIINYKLKKDGYSIDMISDEEKLHNLSRSLFGGSHDIIIGGKHFTEDAKYNHEYQSSGDYTQEEHFHYIKFTIDTMKDLFINNRFIRYISVFQNWLEKAGASINHLHKQLVGLDEWGTSIEKEIKLLRQNKNIFNECAANFAGYNDLIFLENDYALAFADIGHRYPTIAIYSKCLHPRPMEQSNEEIRGMSDIIHAIHCASGNEISTNEEWYYSPPDAIEVMPWHVLIKWRVITPAGFEGGTRIYINPISPMALRDLLVPRLYEMRNAGKIKNVRIAEECNIFSNPLQYYKYKYEQ